MQTRSQIEEKLKKLKPILVAKFHVSQLGYFGSYATGEQTESSDIDIIVEFSQPIGWNFFALEKFLEEEFGTKVDLVTRKALKQQLKEDILYQTRYV